MISYGRHSIDESDIASVVEVLHGDFLTQGDKVKQFEDAFAAYTGARFVVAVSSGTAALHLACIAAGLRRGDKLVTTANTFVASANCAEFLGAEAHFSDISYESLNIDPDDLKGRCENLKHVDAIVPVHFAGAPCDMFHIREIADHYGAVVIEDCCHALGSKYPDGIKVGSCRYSSMSTFSFHPVKAITAGEGGAITTNDERIYRRLLRLRSHGINKQGDSFINLDKSQDNGYVNPWYYEMQELGYNFRITDIQCALVLSQLKRLDDFIARRRVLAARYDNTFSDCHFLESTQKNTRNFSAAHIYPVKIDFTRIKYNRREFMEELKKRGIGSQVHYIPVPAHPYYAKKGFKVSGYPVCSEYYSKALSIPLYFELSNGDQDYVIDSLLELIQ